MGNQEIYNNSIIKSANLYEGCGNHLLIVHLRSNFSYEDIKMRRKLKQLGLDYGCDSVLVLTGDPQKFTKQGYHVTMDVFEPRGDDPSNPHLAGSWSTMCGNGIRAVSRYLVDKGYIKCFIRTQSGLRTATILPHNQFRVWMGQFTTRRKDMRKYVSNFDFADLLKKLKVNINNVVVGLNGDTDTSGHIDGEPHFLIFISNKVESIKELTYLVEEIGPLITSNRKFFPEDINTNLISFGKRESDNLKVLACTFERGIEYVTQACGTGATAIGSYLLTKDKHLSIVDVHMPGGRLRIERGNGGFLMTGPANPI